MFTQVVIVLRLTLFIVPLVIILILGAATFTHVLLGPISFSLFV